jgi:phosphoserine phosphatase
LPCKYSAKYWNPPDKNGFVTGEVKGAIVDGARKAELLRELANKMGISLEQI